MTSLRRIFHQLLIRLAEQRKEINQLLRHAPRQVRPSVGDSLTNDTSSPDVTRGRLEASISGSGQMLFQSTRDR